MSDPAHAGRDLSMLAKVVDAADAREDHRHELERKDTEHRRELKGLLAAVTEALDSFSRVLNARTPPGRENLRLIERQLQRALQQAGAEPIGTVGEVPDPATHTIIETRPGTADAQRDTVLQVLRRGCRYQDEVLWPAEVIVAVPSPVQAAPPEQPDPTTTDEEHA